MSSIAIPQPQILIPRLEFPAWVKRIGDPFRMGQISYGGIYGGLNAGAVGVAQGVAIPHWSTLGGTIAPSHIAAWTPKGALSLAASYVQYGALGSGLTVGLAPTWDVTNGWMFANDAVSTKYLKSGVIPGNGWSIAIRFSNASTIIIILGARVSAPDNGIFIRPNNSGVVTYSYGNRKDVSPTMTSGTLCIAGSVGYRDGVSEATGLNAVITGSIYEIYIGTFNAAGTASPELSTTAYVQAVAFYDVTLTGAQAAALNTAMNAL